MIKACFGPGLILWHVNKQVALDGTGQDINTKLLPKQAKCLLYIHTNAVLFQHLLSYYTMKLGN